MEFPQLPYSFSGIDLVGLAVGAVLLVVGRRLYWLALGAAGFLFGWLVGQQLLPPADDTLRLGLAVVIGLVGMALAFFAQKLAIALGGLLVGGLGALWLSQPWQAELGGWVWLIAILGALLGAGLASAVFDLALVAISSWVGATFVVEALPIADVPRLVTFVVLVLLGFWIQTRGARKEKI